MSVLLNNEHHYLSPSDREKATRKIFNKNQNTIDMLDYPAVTHV